MEFSLWLFFFFSDDSDDETTFGDDDNETSKDYDRFGRLEQLRKDLETELGVEQLVEVYKTVQVSWTRWEEKMGYIF